jgi:ribosomal-protein-alanine N-acetyltransferase
VSVAGDVAELQRIAVDPGHRRDGVATRLLDEVVRLARADGAARVLLEVREDNAGALAFYGATGFAEIARRPRYYRDGATALVLELPLSGPDVNAWATS